MTPDGCGLAAMFSLRFNCLVCDRDPDMRETDPKYHWRYCTWTRRPSSRARSKLNLRENKMAAARPVSGVIHEPQSVTSGPNFMAGLQAMVLHNGDQCWLRFATDLPSRGSSRLARECNACTVCGRVLLPSKYRWRHCVFTYVRPSSRLRSKLNLPPQKKTSN